MLVPSTRASDADRDAALATLRAASVEGRLSVEELDARAERVERARTQRELARLVADLPRGRVAVAGAGAAAPGRRRKQRERAVLGTLRRTGRFPVAERARYTAVLGSVDVDQRRATLPGREVDIELVSLLGRARLRVPPDVDVQVRSGGLLCSREVRVGADPPPPGAPVVRVRTRGLLGTTKVRAQERLIDRLARLARP